MILSSLQTVIGQLPLDLGVLEHLSAWVQVKSGHTPADIFSVDPQEALARMRPPDPTDVVTTNYLFSEKPLTYTARLLPLDVTWKEDSFMRGTTVYVGYVDPEARVYGYYQPIPITRELWHGAVIELGGIHAAIGFSSKERESAFRVFLQEILFSGITERVLSTRLFPDFVKVSGRFFDGETECHLVLLPPVILQILLHLFGEEEDRLTPPPLAVPRKEGLERVDSTKAELEFLADHCADTLRGTRYYFKGVPGSSRVIGFRTGGRYFRLRGGRPETDVASHAAILARQLDPFGVSRIGTKSLRDQMDIAFRVVQTLLRKIGMEDGLKYNPSLPDVEVLAESGRERMERIQEGLRGKPQQGEAEEMLLRMRQGVAPWLTYGVPFGRRFLRFVWIAGTEGDGGLFAVDGNLLHVQMLAMIMDSNVLETKLWKGETYQPPEDRFPNPLRHVLRGGCIVCRYDEEGKLAETEVIDGKMSVPLWHADALGPLTLSNDEKETLTHRLQEAMAVPAKLPPFGL